MQPCQIAARKPAALLPKGQRGGLAGLEAQRDQAEPCRGGDAGGPSWLQGSRGTLTANYRRALQHCRLNFVVLTAARGQTVGKMAVGVKVVTADGQKPGVGAVLLREVVGKTISAVILFVGFLLIAVDGRKRGLHDRIGSTFVEKV